MFRKLKMLWGLARPQWERLLRLKGEILWVVVGQIGNFIAGFLVVKCLSNLLTVEGFGRYALGMTFVGFLHMFFYNPINAVLFRFFPIHRKRETLGGLLRIMQKWHIRAGSWFLLGAFLSAGVLGWLTDAGWGLLVLVGTVYGIISGTQLSFISTGQSLRKRKAIGIFQCLDALFRPAMAVAFILLIRNSAIAVFFGFAIITALLTHYLSHQLRQVPDVEKAWRQLGPVRGEDEAIGAECWGYFRTFLIWSVLGILSTYSDRWIVQGLLGSRDLGLYAAVQQIAAAVIVNSGSTLSQVVIPIIWERAGTLTTKIEYDRSMGLLRKSLGVAILMHGSMVAVCWFWAPRIVRLLTAEAFVEKADLLWIIALANMILFIGGFLQTQGMTLNRPEIYYWPKIHQTVGFVLIAVPLTLRHGVVGLAWAGCLASVIFTLSTMWMNRRLPTFRTDPKPA